MNAKATVVLALSALILVPGLALAQEGDTGMQIHPPALSALLGEKVESVVSLKFVLKIQMSMGGRSDDREKNSEARGVLISETGLILTANSAFEGGIPAPLRRMLGAGLEMKATPTDLRVLFGNDVEEYEARLVARDSNLGIAFVQIMDLKGREVKPVSLSGGASIQIGQELIGITRLPRGFDCAPSLGRLFVRAEIEKPRKMFAVNGEFNAPGHVVFDRFGQPVGILSIQSASEGVSGGGEMDLFAAQDIADNILAVILPLSEAQRSLKAAEKRAAEALEKYAEENEEDHDEKEGEEKDHEDEDGDDDHDK